MHTITRSCKTSNVCQILEEREVPGKGNVSYTITTRPWVSPSDWNLTQTPGEKRSNESWITNEEESWSGKRRQWWLEGPTVQELSLEASPDPPVCEVSRPLRKHSSNGTNEQIKAFRMGTFRTTSMSGPGSKIMTPASCLGLQNL